MGELRGRRRLGVLGGTFDPIHQAHLAMARAARTAQALDLVLFVPAGDPWRKRGRPVTPARHRLAMVRAAVAGEEGFAVSDMEVRREGPPTPLRRWPRCTNMGSSRSGSLWAAILSSTSPTGVNPQRLLQLARLAVIARPDYAVEPGRLDTLVPGLAAAIDWVEMAPIGISATTLRDQLGAGEDVGYAVPAAALAYIRSHHLYGAESSLAGRSGLIERRGARFQLHGFGVVAFLPHHDRDAGARRPQERPQPERLQPGEARLAAQAAISAKLRRRTGWAPPARSRPQIALMRADRDGATSHSTTMPLWVSTRHVSLRKRSSSASSQARI